MKNVDELAGCIMIMIFVEKLTVATLLTNFFSSESDNIFFPPKNVKTVKTNSDITCDLIEL